jgi:hypothetical protein
MKAYVYVHHSWVISLFHLISPIPVARQLRGLGGPWNLAVSISAEIPGEHTLKITRLWICGCSAMRDLKLPSGMK